MYCLVDQGIVYFWMWFTTTSEKIFLTQTLSYKKTVTEHSCHFKYDAICQNCRTYATRYCHSCQKDIFSSEYDEKSGLLWKEICCNSASWCNILMRFYSPLHIRAYTNGIPNLCMPCSLRSTSFSMYFVAVGAYRNGWSVYIFTWWGSGILC